MGNGDGASGARRRILGPSAATSLDFPSLPFVDSPRGRSERKREANAARLMKSVSRFVSRHLKNESPVGSSAVLRSSCDSGLVYELSAESPKGGGSLKMVKGPSLENVALRSSEIEILLPGKIPAIENVEKVEPDYDSLELIPAKQTLTMKSPRPVCESESKVVAKILTLNVEDGKQQRKLEEEIQQARLPLQIKVSKPSCMGSHAVAGALAGVFVSLFLHPLDTIKTVIQSKHTGRQALLPTVAMIVSARGVSGLYRGLGSNLASSAPISAIYTFTYESVKAALLPRLPEEYQSLAHCAAGGCASIATSLVYTPSERIKQQMQVGAVYRNSWLAFVGILQRGGLPALYSGWEAVLCRNVPQSVIKFFTYEGLKHWALRGCAADTNLSNLQTLAFGGLAGSTAALFTTPFDVVKTRFQTQAIGSPHQYTSVLNAFHKITAEEGIRSLYRGLIPRLAIYVSQGALFFASYELFKRTLAVAAAAQPDSPSRNKQRSSSLVNPA